MSALPADEIERIVAAALTGDRAAESRMLEALRPGVLAVLRFGAFHRWKDWTAGCIAVTDEEIEELWRVTPDGTTIEIRP